MPQIAIHCRLVVINPPTRAGFTPRVAPKQDPIRARTVTKIRYYSDGLLGQLDSGARSRSLNSTHASTDSRLTKESISDRNSPLYPSAALTGSHSEASSMILLGTEGFMHAAQDALHPRSTTPTSGRILRRRRLTDQERVTHAVIFENGQVAMECEADAQGVGTHSPIATTLLPNRLFCGSKPWERVRMMNDPRHYAPATLRNRDFILGILRDVLPTKGVILEIASGSGETSFILPEISRV